MSRAIASVFAPPALAAVTSPALATPANEFSSARPLWPSTQSVDTELFELWARRDVAAADMRAASAAAERAAEQMPDWARPGPDSINEDGSPTGDSTGWPALPAELLIDLNKGVHHSARWPMKVRLAPHEVHAVYKHLTADLGVQKRPSARRKRDRLLEARRKRDQLLKAIAVRRREQSREERKAGLPALEPISERATERVLDIEQEILSLSPSTVHTVAAAVLIDLCHECCVDECVDRPSTGTLIVAARVLRALRPQLRGAIASVAGEMLDNPSKPIGEMSLWVDRAPKVLAAA